MTNNPNFNYGEYAIIKNQAGLNSYKISVKEWVEKGLSFKTLEAVYKFRTYMMQSIV